jgi:hypothetical protein
MVLFDNSNSHVILFHDHWISFKHFHLILLINDYLFGHFSLQLYFRFLLFYYLILLVRKLFVFNEVGVNFNRI